MINLILDPLNVFLLGILTLKRDTDDTNLLFVVVLVLMSPWMSPNPIFALVGSSLPCLPHLPLVSPTESPHKPLQVLVETSH